MGPLLAVADTNAAVDNIVEGLAGRGVRVVRLGPAAKARDSLRHLSLEAQAEATPAGRKAAAARDAALQRQERWREGRALGGDPTATLAAAEARSQLEAAESALREAAVGVVARAEVVVCTCTAAGDSLLEGRPWRCVVVDEASQATEPSVLVALTRGSAFVVMAGDPRQLPPTVLSEEAAAQGLGVTLFERVAGEGGVLPLLLDTQYRMHPDISAFPSAFFYGGRLRDGVEAADKPVPRGFRWPQPGRPLALLSVTGGREETSGGAPEMAAAAAATAPAVLRPRGAGGATPEAAPGPASGFGSASGDRSSYRNQAEAALALAVTHQLLAAGDVSSAAILTPYRGQVRLIESLMRGRGLDAAWAARGAEVAVSTVDGYQGREADVVVFSAVRANDRGAVGFLSDPRRMNVAITRPRRGLVVLADTDTLTRGSRDWATYVKWARSQGVVAADRQLIDAQAVLSAAGGGPGAADAAALLSSEDDEAGGAASGNQAAAAAATAAVAAAAERSGDALAADGAATAATPTTVGAASVAKRSRGGSRIRRATVGSSDSDSGEHDSTMSAVSVTSSTASDSEAAATADAAASTGKGKGKGRDRSKAVEAAPPAAAESAVADDGGGTAAGDAAAGVAPKRGRSRTRAKAGE
ncbi:hypothetical protein GPECTOR_26g489 [Gonium pectorale]|uniref:DNA2/NAM7 helicase-like C-terminal domain-containing protein n=1 Tax=Gonium pectorale TaxID=33097 RepID=A0A150GFI8_GONPE|nr:hypothetical protein GPECTOR_26g489 [Gonium pectorale]|eukprot:KXZ48586.1 hypothetical protein GPECTOR_26g489 [Gonium pectorale]